jgi:hypothetical protein
MRRALRPGVLAALSYLAISAALLAPSLRPGHTIVPADALVPTSPFRELDAGRPPHNRLPSDSAYQFAPWLDFMSTNMRQGHIPQWNPEILAGVPMEPNGFVSPYYPPFWLAAVFSPLTAYGVFVAFHLALGALGGYALARTLAVRPWAAWIAGLCTFTALFWIHWSLHLVHIVGMTLTPWMLAAVIRAVRRPGPGSAALLAAGFGLWWLGANPQYAFYGTVAMGVVALSMLCARLVRERALPWRPLATVAGGVVLGAALAAPVLLPTAGATGNVLRRSQPVDVVAISHFPTYDLLALLVPDIRGSGPANVLYRPEVYGLALESPFVGITTLVLALTALGAVRRKTWLPWVLGGAVIVVLSFTALPHHVLYALLPGYGRFRAVMRWLSILPAVLIPAAAGGMAAILSGEKTARRVALGAAAGLGVALVVIGAVVLTSDRAPKHFLAEQLLEAAAPLAAVALAVVLAKRRREVAIALVAVAILGEAVVHTAPWYTSVKADTAYPRLPLVTAIAPQGGRIIRVDPNRTTLAGLAPDIPMVYGLDDAQGLAVIYPADYDRYRRLIDDYGNFAEDFNADPPLADPSMLSSPLLDVLDVRTVLASSAVTVPPQYPLISDGEPRAYARPSLGPAALVPKAVPAPNAEAMWASVSAPGWSPGRTASVLGLKAPVDGVLGSVTRADSGKDTDSDSWNVLAPSGGLLRVSGRYADGWSATVDGKDTRVYRTDGIFRGIVVPPGIHLVSERYRNPDEGRGRKVALAAVAVLAGLGASTLWRRRTRDQSSRRRLAA